MQQPTQCFSVCAKKKLIVKIIALQNIPEWVTTKRTTLREEGGGEG